METKIERGDEDMEKEAEKGRGDEMRHGERNKEFLRLSIVRYNQKGKRVDFV